MPWDLMFRSFSNVCKHVPTVGYNRTIIINMDTLYKNLTRFCPCVEFNSLNEIYYPYKQCIDDKMQRSRWHLLWALSLYSYSISLSLFGIITQNTRNALELWRNMPMLPFCNYYCQPIIVKLFSLTSHIKIRRVLSHIKTPNVPIRTLL